MSSNSIEEYLETIYNFNELGLRAKNTDIANTLKVSPPSVTQMVQKLAEEGLVEYEPYKGTILTGKGTALAQKVVRKHRLLERFLFEHLGIDKEKIHEEACKMEHSISDEVAAALCEKMDSPVTSPDDSKPIPPCIINVEDCDECSLVREKESKKLMTQLSHIKPGEEGEVAFIRAGTHACQRLLDMGFTKGVKIKVVNAAPFQGPIEVQVRGTSIALGRGLANQVYIEIMDNGKDHVHHRLSRHHIVMK